jgi:formiminotetrahydrofolate cyclodeaminase
MNIDLHNHVIPSTIVDAIARDPKRYGTSIEEKDGKRYFNSHGRLAELQKVFYDADAKVEWMDENQLDIAAICVGPPIYFYWLSPEVGLEAAKLANDGIAQMVAKRPDRLRGMAHLPMQDPDAAITELEWLLERGARMVHLRPAPVVARVATLTPLLRPAVQRPFGREVALAGALAAALVAMVARYCDAPALVERADRLVTQAQQLVADDERAFGAVAEAWALPRGGWPYDEERRSAIGEALLGASEPQAQVVEIAIEVLVLIDLLRPAARSGLLSDLVAAGEVARAGSAIARMNVESNLRTLPDSERRSGLLRRMGVAKERT